ncbi:MAG: hydroxymethylglutaryl-CoA lyase [Ignavibacteriaceae bacterium]|nr:hydroxymethylglutaryl-CoA lyase [Ignavibacteriaceae bacterium]
MKDIIIHEVGMRDGLQAEESVVLTEQKIKWIKKLGETGVDIIQVGSFVNPKRMPQMADTDELFNYFSLKENKLQKVTLSGLVLNEKGLERGMACGVEMFCMGVSASETHSQKNTGMTTAEATTRIIDMAKSALASGKEVQVSVQSAFGCGFEGKISEEKVLSLVSKFLDNGFKNINLADTAGHAIPDQIERLFTAIFKLDPNADCVCHLHNTYGLGLANAYAAYRVGVRTFESSFAGLGGCPFTAIAAGNVSTEDLVHMFQNMNLRNDIKIDKLIGIAKEAAEYFKRELPGVIYKTGKIPEILHN